MFCFVTTGRWLKIERFINLNRFGNNMELVNKLYNYLTCPEPKKSCKVGAFIGLVEGLVRHSPEYWDKVESTLGWGNFTVAKVQYVASTLDDVVLGAAAGIVIGAGLKYVKSLKKEKKDYNQFDL